MKIPEVIEDFARKGAAARGPRGKDDAYTMRTRSAAASTHLGLLFGLAVTLPFGCAPLDESGRSEDAAEHEDEEGAYDGTQPIGKADGTTTPQFSWPTVRHGDQSRTVVAAQYLLREHGKELSLTGKFDTATELAAVGFQASKGLVDDGIIGSRTWEAMVVTVRPGDTNRWAVRAVEDLLKHRYGYALEIDGNLDAATEELVRRFQEERCLGVDGIVGKQTWHALVADTNNCSQAGRLLELHDQGKITLSSSDFGRNDGADPLANVTDTAAGRQSKRSCNFAGGGRDSRLPCGSVELDEALLDAMVALHEEHGFTYFVTAISGARHSTNSYHYKGRAVDIGVVNGVVVNGSTQATRRLVQACIDMGAIEALGPHNDAHHQDHIHCAF